MTTSTTKAFRCLIVSATAIMVASVGLLSSGSASAQTVAGLDLRFVQLDANIAAALPTGGQLTQLIVQNIGPALGPTPVVLRFPPTPNVIQVVSENANPIGVIDPKTGVWYHTLSSLGEGRSITFLVNWYAACAGKWPLVARVGERRVSVVVQFVGQSLQNCGPDEVAAPTPPAYYDLPWPPTPTTSTTTTTTTILPSTVVGSTSSPSSIGGPVPSTIPGSTVPGSPTLSTVPTAPTTRPPTTRPPTTKSRKPTTTLEIVCKTVGSRRYCGPKSSALKPGAPKPREVKPVTTRKKKP
jgi:hypothetical protein